MKLQASLRRWLIVIVMESANCRPLIGALGLALIGVFVGLIEPMVGWNSGPV